MKVVKMLFMMALFGVTFTAGMLSTQFKVVSDCSTVQKMQKAMRDCPQFKNMTVQDGCDCKGQCNCCNACPGLKK